MPDWNKRNYSILNAKALKETWFDKDLSFVLLDVRPAKEAKQGFIKGAVNLTEKDLGKALKSFPNKELKPPIVIYDAKGDGSAEKVALQLVKAGYPGPRVLTGGYAAWQAANYDVNKGNLAKKVVYVPKPKPGTIAVAEFETIARKTPANVQIIDVRNTEEVSETGTIKGAINIPVADVADRLADVPKDKEVILHCTNGPRAEMAFNVLKEKGYKVRFLDAPITPAKNGTFTIQKTEKAVGVVSEKKTPVKPSPSS
jgi:rhodanese-related sulfurtransferase